MIVGFFPATTMPDAEWWQALWPDPTKVLVEMGVQPGMVVVDLCCGDGLFTAPLARIAESVYAIDVDPAMLGRARAFVAAAGATNCHFALRIEARDVALIVKPAGLLLNRTVELPPYHYGAIFVKEEERMSEGLPIDAIALREEVQVQIPRGRGQSARQLPFPHRTLTGEAVGL